MKIFKNSSMKHRWFVEEHHIAKWDVTQHFSFSATLFGFPWLSIIVFYYYPYLITIFLNYCFPTQKWQYGVIFISFWIVSFLYNDLYFQNLLPSEEVELNKGPTQKVIHYSISVRPNCHKYYLIWILWILQHSGSVVVEFLHQYLM